jgi:hypothetical protein
MGLCTAFFARTSQDYVGTAATINDQAAVAGMHNAQLLEEIAG